jgi:glycosyltransferase involved in cell wall biosynthesis
MATRVALITPPLESSGGIGRLMSYVVATMSAEDVAIRVLDPRGSSLRPILSIFPLARAWLQLVSLGLTRGVDVAHINVSSHGSSIRKPVMLWTCRLFHIPVVLHLHASEYPEFFDSLPQPAKAFLRRTFSRADLVLVLGSRWKDFVCHELHVPAEKVVVLLNASPGPSTIRTLKTRGSEPLKILFLGRLGKRKGVPEILQALNDVRVRHKPWIATLAGDGDIALYSAEAERLGLDDRVVFPGWVDTDEAQQLLAESDLLLLPSRAEGLPMSVIEAFAYGVPVVGTPVGAIPDILGEDVNGLLVQPGDDVQLADALLKILNDEPLRLKLAQNARRTWEERLDIASYGRKLASCWSRVAAGERP